ncbi:hypothetical protein AVEN_94302-1 [Araneus ventricosus]|uniref:Uncharacterized protein n=1 Tax=Araneus ventricosus TaxID=182803 RepID=A0A4Y2U7W3_ARAVE|nr:hypothetical protein AVEN_234078-1 [Araneus ventricosus]GBO08563.1 hypothetical protein AVEN_94302-1 [Araneus ventricosus]
MRTPRNSNPSITSNSCLRLLSSFFDSSVNNAPQSSLLSTYVFPLRFRIYELAIHTERRPKPETITVTWKSIQHGVTEIGKYLEIQPSPPRRAKSDRFPH